MAAALLSARGYLIYHGDRYFSLVTLPYLIFNCIVAEIVRWNDTIRNVGIRLSLCNGEREAHHCLPGSRRFRGTLHSSGELRGKTT